MDKSELIKSLADYDGRREVVKVAIKDDEVRRLLFSLVEERAIDKTLDIPMDYDGPRRIGRELDILLNAMDAVSEIGAWDSQLVQPIIPSVINLLDYEFYYTNKRAAEIIASAVNKDSIELIRPAIPKLINLLEHREIIIEDTKIDNMDSVGNAQRALLLISVIDCESLKDAIPKMIKYADDYGSNIKDILTNISGQNCELLKPILPEIIEHLNNNEYIRIIGDIARNDVEMIKPALPILIEQLDNQGFQEESSRVLGIIAERNVGYAQSAIPKLIKLLDSGGEWVRINTARSLKIISQQDETLIRRLDSIIDNVSLFDEVCHLENTRDFYAYDLSFDAVNKNPNDPEALKAFGEMIGHTFNRFEFDISTKSKLKAREKSIEYFKKSAEIKPSFEIYKHIGLAYQFFWIDMADMPEGGEIDGEIRQDLTRKSIYYYTKASELNPEDIECKWKISALNDQLGNHEDALLLMEELYQKDPDNDEVPGRLADFYVDAAKRLNNEGKYYEAYNFLIKAKSIEGIYPGTRDELDQLLGDENLKSKLKSQLNNLNSKIKTLAKERSEKFSEAGEMAYSECIGDTPELAPDAKTELDDILAIDTLISKTNQEMEKAKGGKKKTGFLAKLGDTVSSVAKQGKLKVELYNLERKKKSAITDFGEALWESHKSGDDTLQELSDIWHAIEDMEQQIHENEEEIDNLNELLG
jgi:tetratricopeptide (TPR) repeat protein